MKRLLVLGAGFVAGPLVRYFLDRTDVAVAVADLDLERARDLVGARPTGEALRLDLRDEAALRREISRSDLVVSLVPYTFHPLVARLSLAERKPMVTTSYVSEALQALDAEARRAGVLILNEVGLDPGIDHLEAKKVIDEVHGQGGRVLEFRSYCGGLPAPEARDNPFGYKFSWSPRGVLLAGRNSARHLHDGQDVFIRGEDLFSRPETVSVEGLGEFEGYPNRDSLPYLALYGIPEARTIFRGTLRWPGWCETLKVVGDMGYLASDSRPLAGRTHGHLAADLLGRTERTGLREALAEKIGRPVSPDVWARLEWLGLFSDGPVPSEAGSALDVLEALMVEKLSYRPGERDMIVLQHDFRVSYPDGREESLQSTLVDFGQPDGASAMARTVGFPAAAAVRLILEGRVESKGVLVPVAAEFYRPILDELRTLGIVFKETRTGFAGRPDADGRRRA